MSLVFAIFDDLQKAVVAGMNMNFHYWMAYMSTIARYPDSYVTDFSKPYYFENTLPQSDIESGLYLKSESFLDSFSSFVKSAVNLYSANEMLLPVMTAAIFMDKYASATRASLLKLQQIHHKEVYKMDDTILLHYSRPSVPEDSKKKYSTPLLIVYAPVNRYHVMDIRRGRSIVEHFILAGFDVFLLDWGKQINNKPSISDYISYLHESVNQIKNITGSQQVSILGYSWGGVLSMIYSSLRPKNIRNLMLQSAHVDFDKDASILASWFRKLPIDDIVHKFDFVDCRLINLALIMRNPAVHSFDAFRFAIAMNKEVPSFITVGLDAMRIAEWLDDSPLIPTGFFRDYIGKLYQENQLVKKELEITLSSDGNSETVDLTKITMPLLNIIGTLDDICTPSAALPINDIAASADKEILWFPTGHIELSVSSAAHNDLWPKVTDWLEQRSH
jgi:polyhydroxyalkanoate synthase